MRRELVFLLEEESAKALLDSFLPRLLAPGIQVRTMVFEGKQDLQRRMAQRIRGYVNPAARFVLLSDQDSTPDCRVVKQRFLEMCSESGRGNHCLVRIACRELEAFYLADLRAVSQALEIPGLENAQNSQTFRNPDVQTGPSVLLERLTGGSYQKVGGSRRIGQFLDPRNTRSPSFRNFVAAILRQQDELLSLP